LEGGKPLLRLHLAREMRWGKVWEVGSCILAYDGYTVGVYELDSKCRWQQDCGDAAIAFGGGRVALLSRGSLRLLRWEDGQEILTRANPQAPPPVQQGPLYMLVDTTAQQLAWSDDGRWLASSHRQNVILWDAETCRPVHTWEHQASVSWLGFRGQRLAVSLSDTLGSTILMGLSKTFFVYHPDSRETLYKADGLRAVNRVEHAADWVGLGCSEQIFWLSIGDPIQARGPIKRHEISLTSLAAGMLACHSLGDNLEIIDLQNAQTVATWQGLTHCQLAPDGTWALALSHGKLRRCQLWDQRPVCELTDLSSAGPRARAYVEALQG